MKVSELKKALSYMLDEADVEFCLHSLVPEEDLSQMTYKYPYNLEELEYVDYDCGYSDSVFVIFLEKVALGE